MTKQFPSQLIYLLLIKLSCNSKMTQRKKLKPPIPELTAGDPTSVRMNPDSISTLVRLINTNPPNDFRGMVVFKNGKLVIEEYFNSYWRETIRIKITGFLYMIDSI